MNWRLNDGRIENTHGGWVNEVHALTHQLKDGDGTLKMSVRIGSLSVGQRHKEITFVGFKVGAVGHRNHYLSNILHDLQNGFATQLMNEPPIPVGITSEGRLMIGTQLTDPELSPVQMSDAVLEVEVSYKNERADVRLKVLHSGKEIATLKAKIQRQSLSGNVALACHGLNPPENKNKTVGVVDHARFWFSDWKAGGSKFSISKGQIIGPILWSQYTLHKKTLKMMAFFVPMGAQENNEAELQVQTGTGWETVATATIEPLSNSALFRVENWNDQIDRKYRITYKWNDARGESLAEWSGTVRKDPLDKETILLAGLSCSNSDLFPNRFLLDNLLKQDPDLVFFSGDQIYEANGGYGVVEAKTKEDVPRAALNYLGKFWLSILGFRDLLKDRPTVMTPDDHDLYSNDLWGKGGVSMDERRCFGGYGMHADWVNMVEYTQMGNRPDPYDPTPIAQGIKSYTTALNVGGVSFALINDRKFKSAPGDVIDEMAPLFEARGERNIPLIDTINEEDFDTNSLNRGDLNLLGEMQLRFLSNWAKDDSKLKAVLHQSPFCQPHHLMVADMDSNGWPQSGRKRALEVIREANAIMVAGDLHFATLVKQGIDDWDDGGWTFTLPSVSTNTHRAWRPKVKGQNTQPHMPDYTGRFLDGWNNKITMWAAANPGESMVGDSYKGDGENTLQYLRESAQGYGIVRFHKSTESVTFESWPVYGEFKGVDKHDQHPGFPKTVKISKEN
ncbi:MAG: alkaline phosphatase D family protein [Cyclobacteriaceae bacterium]